MNPPVTGRLLVVCKDDQALDVIDLETGITAGRVRASDFTPHEVAGTRDGTRAYLPIYSDVFLGKPGTDGRAIDVVDLVTLKLIDTIPLDFAARPHLPLVAPDGLIYVGTELDESVSVIDPVTRSRVHRLPTGRPESHMFVLAPDGSRLYSANVASGSISVVDARSGSLIDVIDVAERINRISIAPDGRTVYTADQTLPRLAAMDTLTGQLTWIDLPSPGFGTAVTSDGRSIVVALRGESMIAVIDLADTTAMRLVDVPRHPQAIVIHPSGGYAYSACDAAGQVVEVDLARVEVSRTFETGRGADGIAWVAHPGAA